MAWTRYESTFTKHPKVQAVPAELRPAALALHMACTGYCGDLLTDGFVPDGVIAGLAAEVGVSAWTSARSHSGRTVSKTDNQGVEKVLKALLSSGLFDRAKGGYQVHDYTDWNPTAAEVKERRKRDAERKKASRVREESDAPSARTSARTPQRSPRGPRGRAGARSHPVPEEPPRKALSGTDVPAETPPADSDLNGSPPPAHRAETWIRNAGWQEPHLRHTLRHDYGITDPHELDQLTTLANEIQERETTDP